MNYKSMRRRSFGIGTLGIVLTLSMLLSFGNAAVQATSAPTVVATASVSGALQRITPDNAKKLIALPRLGRGVVYAIEWSPDDKTLAVGGPLGVWLYTTADFSQQPRLLPDAQSVGIMAFSSDGIQLTTVDGNGTVNVWDVASGRPTQTLTTILSKSDVVALNRDGTLLAFLHWNQMVVWNIPLNKPMTKIASGFADLVAINPDGSYLVTDNGSSVLAFWDGKTGKQLATADLNKYDSWVIGISFSPDSNYLVVAMGDRPALLVDISGGQFAVTKVKEPSSVAPEERVIFSQDGQRLLVGGVNGAIAIVDANSGNVVQSLQTPSDLYSLGNGEVYNGAFSPDGKRLATVGESAGVLVWNLTANRLLNVVQPGVLWWSDIAFSPDGQRLALADADGMVSVWDVSDDVLWNTLPNHNAEDLSTLVTFSPDGKQIVTADDTATIRFWDTADGKLLHSFQANVAGRDHRLLSLAFKPNGQQLAIIGYDGLLQLLDPQTGAETVQLQGGSDNIGDAAYSPDGSQIAAGDSDGNVLLWDTANGTLLKTMTSHLGTADLTFSPDGKYLATASDDLVVLWDVAHAKLLITLQGHHNNILALAFSPDSQLLASIANDGQLLVWSVAKHALRASLVLGSASYYFESLAFSPDGSRLVAAGDDGTIWVWGVPGAAQ